MDLVKLLEAFRERCAYESREEADHAQARGEEYMPAVWSARFIREIDVAKWLASQPALDVGPRVCVAALVTDPAGFGLFVRNRKRNAASTTPAWELPGGGMNPGETWQEAVAREVREETGIAIETDGTNVRTVLHGAAKPGAEFRSLIIVARCYGRGGPVAGDDAIEARWFAPQYLPPLADLDTARIAREWAGAW